MIHEEDVEFLEHYGVKGMRWGVRRNRTKTPKTSVEKRERNVKYAKRAAIGIGVVGGAAAASLYLAKSGKLPAPKFSSGNNANIDKINKVLNATKKVKVSDISSAPKPKAKSGPSKSITDLINNQNRIIKEANADLKARYEAGQVPFPEREYLDLWS